jgi:hypothetical protein
LNYKQKTLQRQAGRRIIYTSSIMYAGAISTQPHFERRSLFIEHIL